MEMGSLCLRMDNLMESGSKICMMGRGKNYEMMEQGIKENMLMGRGMAKEGTNGKMDPCMRESGVIIIFKDK